MPEKFTMSDHNDKSFSAIDSATYPPLFWCWEHRGVEVIGQPVTRHEGLPFGSSDALTTR